jgi:hypothetical protein
MVNFMLKSIKKLYLIDFFIDIFIKIDYVIFMKKLTIILSVLLLALTSCKVNEGEAPANTETPATPTPTTPPSTPSTDPLTGTKEEQLTALINQFKADYSATWTTIVLGFKPSSYMNSGGGSTTTVGVCEVYSDGSKKVWMNQEWWEQSSTTDLAKKVLLYHELGHCHFQRGHDTRTYSGGRPYSMMYPILDPVVANYNSFTSYYIAELANSALGGTMVALTKMAKTTTDDESTLLYSSRTDEDGVCLD